MTVSEKPVVPATAAKPASSVQKYLDQALAVLQKYGILPQQDAPPQLLKLLEEVRHVDEPKVMTIGKTVQYMQSFNAMVRDNVEDIRVGNRFLEISQQFDSIRDDSKTLIAQLDDGKISFTERMSNLWMKMRRGTPSDRFQKIAEIYKAVTTDTQTQLQKEAAIMEGYIDFRFALKEAEIVARELLDKQTATVDQAKGALATAQKAVDDSGSADAPTKSRLQLARDQAMHAFQKEDRHYQLIKDIAENLQIGYDVGETLVAKLKQTHDVKDQVYRRSVTFFTTNEHVFTILGAVYTSQHGLHEATQAQEALKRGVNKGLEDVADLGRDLERAALKAGYGSTIDPKSVEKLVTAITDYQVDSLKLVAELRKESDANAREIRKVVENGKQRFQDTVAKFARGDQV
ncbi:MAG: cell surface protein [Planctomycetes bacterium]|nr:cell surface protein [Planctomycetota bacterium]